LFMHKSCDASHFFKHICVQRTQTAAQVQVTCFLLCVQTTYPNDAASGFVRDVDQWRAFLGRFGISGKMQTSLIKQLSDGQKSRIVFATMCMRKPNMLLLDEVSMRERR